MALVHSLPRLLQGSRKRRLSSAQSASPGAAQAAAYCPCCRHVLRQAGPGGGGGGSQSCVGLALTMHDGVDLWATSSLVAALEGAQLPHR